MISKWLFSEEEQISALLRAGLLWKNLLLHRERVHKLGPIVRFGSLLEEREADNVDSGDAEVSKALDDWVLLLRRSLWYASFGNILTI